MVEVPDEQRLMRRLLTNYDVASRPVFNASHKVVVKFGLTLAQISDMVMTRLNHVLYFLHVISSDTGLHFCLCAL